MRRLLALLLMLVAGSQAHAAVPAVSKSFSPTTTSVGGTSTLTLSIANTNSYALTSVAFTDAFPSAMVVAATPALTNTCGGTITGGTSGSSTLTLSGGGIAASGSCTITVAVTTTASGVNVYTNTAGGVSADQWTGSGAASNSASLIVTPAIVPPTITMSYSANPVPALGISQLTITITNPNFTTLTGIAFSDTYPAGGMGNVLTPITTDTCGGIATGASLANSLSLTGGSLPAAVVAPCRRQWHLQHLEPLTTSRPRSRLRTAAPAPQPPAPSLSAPLLSLRRASRPLASIQVAHPLSH